MRGGIHNIGKGIWSVYKHTSPSGKLYIGITSKEPKKRWGKNGIHYKGQAFYNAIVKYGWDNIEHEVICNNITEFEAKEMEKELIKKFNSMDWRYGYNCTRGGDGLLGYKRSQESINKTIEGNSKRVYQYSLDGKFIKEWNSAISIETELGFKSVCIGNCCLEKDNRKQAYGYVWRHVYTDCVEAVKLEKGITVYQYLLNGKFLKEWASAEKIEKQLGFAATNIGSCCRGLQKTAYGYIWSFDKKDRLETKVGVCFYQYDLSGNYIQEFNSVKEASKCLGFIRLPIVEVCKGNRHQAGGYLWSYEKKESITPPKRNERIASNKKLVYQYSTDGDFIKEWESVSECAYFVGGTASAICECCNHNRNIAYGYIWRYEKLNKVDKIVPKIRKINQYTKDGIFIKTWNNAHEVKMVLGFDNGSIGKCCMGKQQISNGYIWKYSDT